MFYEHLRDHWEAVTGDFVVALEAERFYGYMAADHPADLAQWQQAKAKDFIIQEFRALLSRERAKARSRAGVAAFREYADKLKDDGGVEDPAAMDVFRQAFVVNRDHLWRHVADMTGVDHRFVADEYDATGKRALAHAAFHRAIAKKVGMRRTADVFTEAEYMRLQVSFVAPKEAKEGVA